jgi:hypothetical protein|tara:strand:+ start:152 stop:787 length:636 start_codon:yes stop_codon:yes gene_type:complete
MGCWFLLKEEQKLQKRYVAYKVSIGDVLSSGYKKVDGFDANYLEVDGKQVSRVNVIAVLVQKAYMQNYTNLILDDGTGEISARSFESNPGLDNLNVGDFVLIIGKPREFSQEKYLLIEIVRRVDGGWAKARRRELGNKGINVNSKGNVVESKVTIDKSPRDKLIKIIKEKDEGEGVSVGDIDFDDVDRVVDMLLKEGNIFEVKPGRVKVLE